MGYTIWPDGVTDFSFGIEGKIVMTDRESRSPGGEASGKAVTSPHTLLLTLEFAPSPGDLTCILCGGEGADYETVPGLFMGKKRLWSGAHGACIRAAIVSMQFPRKEDEP
jgi:hypothetical protein